MLHQKIGSDFAFAVEDYLQHIMGDYCSWNKNDTEVGARMRDEFILGVRVDLGKKYAKVVTRGSAHSFIVLQDSGQFRKGDILMAAAWAAPATNFSRGNVLTKNYGNTTWTGAR
jgi:hypothetical protein